MPKYICSFEHNGQRLYFDWSTVVDAPVSYAVPREEYERQYEAEYGRSGMQGLPERLARADAKGTSSLLDDSLESLIRHNRAGDNEKLATWEQIRAMVLDKE